MGRIFGRCSNCGALRIGGPTEGEHAFCSEECHDWWSCPGDFCANCLAETTEEPPGNTTTYNFTGARLRQVGGSTACGICKSKVMKKWFVVFYVPIFPLSGPYRVKYVNRERYNGRRMIGQFAGALHGPNFDPRKFVLGNPRKSGLLLSVLGCGATYWWLLLPLQEATRGAAAVKIFPEGIILGLGLLILGLSHVVFGRTAVRIFNPASTRGKVVFGLVAAGMVAAGHFGIKNFLESLGYVFR